MDKRHDKTTAPLTDPGLGIRRSTCPHVRRTRLELWSSGACFYGGFQKWRHPKMDGLQITVLLKWIIEKEMRDIVCRTTYNFIWPLGYRQSTRWCPTVIFLGPLHLRENYSDMSTINRTVFGVMVTNLAKFGAPVSVECKKECVSVFIYYR